MSWLADKHGLRNLEPHRNHYDSVCRSLSEAFSTSPFWRRVIEALRNIDVQYNISTKYPLIATFDPKILTKPWSSFLEKSYRKNIAENTEFPNPPSDGWCVPPCWYSQIHDMVRTAIIVKYIDGVPLVLQQLQTLAFEEHLVCTGKLETRTDGYYGAHFDVVFPCDITTIEWSKENRDMACEIQITTKIKEVIKNLLHTYYEATRQTGKRSDDFSKVAWNYRDDEFVATYLGHILHYVEGMIIAVRDKRRSPDA